jgi:hypothetical protein
MSVNIWQQLLSVQHKMKTSSEKKIIFREFEMDDLVFPKLQPYINNSTFIRFSHKLDFKYYGPDRVLARVGKVAYQFELLEMCHNHIVIHVSQLKKAMDAQVQMTWASLIGYPLLPYPSQDTTSSRSPRT